MSYCVKPRRIHQPSGRYREQLNIAVIYALVLIAAGAIGYALRAIDHGVTP